MKYHLPQCVFVMLLLIPYVVGAQQFSDTSSINLQQQLQHHTEAGIQFLYNTQRRTSAESPVLYYKGEWPTTMGLRIGFFLLGKKKPVDDSNCFSVSTVHNTLAKIYLGNQSYRQIPEMLDLSFTKIKTYRNGNRFNFWNLQQPYRTLKKGDVPGQQPLVRRPTNFKLRTRYINNAANVVEDADDTALAYSAIKLRSKVLDLRGINDSSDVPPSGVSSVFSPYLDTNRHNRHWYNYLNGNDHNTGAFLTWLGDEYQFKRWNILKVIGHNATFFLSFSECFPHAYVPYIPYGSNDLDAVVNANVLGLLSLYGELDADGVDGSIRFIEKKSMKKKYDRVGIYYPNRFQFPYAVAKAYSSGVDRLENSKNNIIAQLKKRQQKDGSWKSRRIVNKKDQVQSTAYALNALVNFGDYEKCGTKEYIERGIQFLLNNAMHDENGVHWKGGVFFSGGTVIRNTLFWKSDAYTTVIIIDALATYQNYLQSQYPLKLNQNVPD